MTIALVSSLALVLAVSPVLAETRLSTQSEAAYKASITAMSSELTRQDLQYVIQHIHDLILLKLEAKTGMKRAESIALLGKDPQLFWDGLKRFEGMTAREIVMQKGVVLTRLLHANRCPLRSKTL